MVDPLKVVRPNFLCRSHNYIVPRWSNVYFAAALQDNGIANARLLMVGGHDPLCLENVEHLKELKNLSQQLNLSIEGNNPDVTFRVNIYQKILPKS